MPFIQEVYTSVEFKTLDGLILRGRLYAASTRGPAVVMTPGVCKPPLQEGSIADSISGIASKKCFFRRSLNPFRLLDSTS